MNNFVSEDLQQYEITFGLEKISFLWNEFLENSRESIEKTQKTQDVKELRLLYHNLKSSSLIFGMRGFAKLCSVIEQKIIDGQNAENLEKEIKSSKILFNEEILMVENYLKQRLS